MIRKLFTFFGVFFLLTGGAFAAPPSDPATEAGFIPHKALYKIGLVSTKSGSQIINIDGQMFYQWESTCDGWTSDNRFKILYEYADSDPMAVESDFSTFETFDGKSLNFSSQRKRDDEVFEEMRGQALLDQKDGGGEAKFSIPDGLSYKLEPGTLFPMQHTLEVLKHVKAGDKFFKAVIFDGSDEAGPVEVNAFIGKEVDGAEGFKQSDDFDLSLLKGKARKVRLAFFPLNDTEATSDYEMDLVMHENGVISDMTIYYEDFALSQKLIALEPQKGSCKSPAPVKTKGEAIIKPGNTPKPD
ncbi:MAG: cell envelope integrity EipB family protein [Alphaproteobacteria bacterium]|nr:cell envelope integrity EipB family protein [Alphaproteobacteria bacterium]